MPKNRARVVSINMGQAREFEYHGRPAKSAIWKAPVAGPSAARGGISQATSRRSAKHTEGKRITL
jgi:hypothetical protein